MTEAGGACSYKPITGFCNTPGDYIFSSAVYNDTYYFITVSSKLYSAKLGTPGSCALLASFPLGPFGATAINSFTVDKDGMLYLVEYNNLTLQKFNPYTKVNTVLGQLPAPPAGDLIFYGNKLLLSTATDGIYELNLNNPMASKQYMPTPGYAFYGLISFPYQCNKNKVYGFAPSQGGTGLIELDLDNKTVVGLACTLPLLVYDGASIVETGNTIGVNVDSIIINAPCELTETKGSAKVVSYSATPGALTYKLNTNAQNNDGVFGQLDMGAYQVRITNDIGCIKDTFFTITRGLSPDIRITAVDPQSCDLQNGSLFIQTFSPYQPVAIRLNNGPPLYNNMITDMGAGLYNISISDQGNCKRDTSVILKYKQRPVFLGAITHTPSVCEASSGTIQVGINGNGTGISASLNNGAPQSDLLFKNLQSGNYLLSVFSVGNCRYDTLLNIGKIYDPRPQITMQTTDQFCFDNNGIVTIYTSGAGSPFSYNFNNSGFVTSNRFDKLAPGSYRFLVRNSNSCQWDSAVEIMAYPKHPVEYTVSKVDPDCKVLESGQMRINITGTETPYTLRFNNKLYGSGETIFSRPGDFTIPILNQDQCVVDSAKVSLTLIVEPECDRVSVPNAFSPNNDGNNDIFRPLHGPYIRKVVMTIYNRYGQVIYRNADAHTGWNGRYGAHLLDQGAYPWTLTYENYLGEKKKMSGLVLLVR